MTDRRGPRFPDANRAGSLSDEDIERRLGGQPATGSRPTPRPSFGGRPRLLATRGALLRDAGTLVGAALLAVIAFQVLSGAGPGATPGYSTPPGQTGVAVGSLPGPTQPPLPTLGAIVNPGIHLDATPTPVPVITLPPLKPKAKATPKPTATPAPVAAFSCVTGPSLSVSFTNSSTGLQTTWLWSFGDGVTSTQESPPPHTYPGASAYTVTLEVTGPGGHDAASHACTAAP